MSSFLDASVIVRYLTGDPPELAEQAAGIIDIIEDLQITDIVLVDVAHVLTSVYRVPRKIAIDHLIAFLQKSNISIFALDKSMVIQALFLCRSSGKVSITDAMVWAAVQTEGSRVVYSFEERFPGDGLKICRTAG